jgi:DNA-binding response OmpR family regulator
MSNDELAYIAVTPSTVGRLRVLHAGDIALELDGHRVRLPDGRRVQLPRREHDLLRVLMQNPGRPMTHRELLDQVWGPGYQGASNTLAVHIRRLRLALDPGQGRIYGRIRSVRRLGYVFVPTGD